MSIENKELIYIDYKQNITLIKETYNWGRLRILRHANCYTCVIHPEHMGSILRQENFQDEQGSIWQPIIEGESLTLKSTDGESFTVPLEQLQ